MSEIVDEIRQWSENIKLPYRLRQLLKISLEQMEELSSEKKHGDLGWEQSNKWLEENGRLRDELDQVKKEKVELWNCPDCGFGFDSGHTDIGGGYSCPLCELEEKDKVLEESHEIIDSIPKGGSKEGRPDYVTMVTSDKIYRLRTILSQYKKGDTTE